MTAGKTAGKRPRGPHRVRLPGFVRNDEIGLGTAIGRAAASLRIRPCEACRRRAAMLDRWLVIGRARSS